MATRSRASPASASIRSRSPATSSRSTRDVFDALDLANVRSIASFDAAAVQARLERLPWIATAELTRVYPDRLDVRIAERKPFAVWARGDRSYLIDATGRVLSAVSATSAPICRRSRARAPPPRPRSCWRSSQRYPSLSRAARGGGAGRRAALDAASSRVASPSSCRPTARRPCSRQIDSERRARPPRRRRELDHRLQGPRAHHRARAEDAESPPRS